ncbi:MAG: type II toxin-antitoxin system PemK/MazF family toxin [Acidobacteria bacterium]|nr:type II toxin-antitoxin system PemK/MazF family toxin [Acidobacteriota bacterium]
MVVERFGLYLVRLDPTEGHEIRKTRPCVVVSPDEMNRHIGTVIVAPMTTKRRPYPTRVKVQFAGKEGQIALDQIRTVDKRRLVKASGRINDDTADRVIVTLQKIFAK